MDENRLIQRCRRGDSEAFDRLYAKYSKPLFNFIYRLVNDHELSCDLLQDTFLKILIGPYESRGKFSTWIYKVATNLCLNEIVKAKRTVPLEEDPPNPRDSPSQEMERKELSQKIEKAISSLPTQQRVAFCLRNYQGLPYGEIASLLECPLGTVKSRIHCAVQNLKSYLEEYHEMRGDSEETP